MADPIVRFHGSNLIEIVDGITTHYIKKDCIQFINISAYRIGIHVVGRSDVLYMTFMDKKVLHATMNNIVTGLSVMGQNELDEVKSMIEGVRNDMKQSMTTVTTALDSFKEDIQGEFKKELARSVVELSATDESLEERVAALEEVEADEADDASDVSDSAEEIVPVIKTTPGVEFIMAIMLVIFILAAFATMFKQT